jgi:uncharacterized membrane protein
VHYAHEARNYSLAMCLVLAASLLAFLSTQEGTENKKFVLYSLSLALVSGLSFLTNYLTIFSISALLLWYVFWVSNRRRIMAVSMVILAAVITLTNTETLLVQLNARPNQFQKTLGFGEELYKVIKFNSTIFWNPVSANSAISFTVLLITLTLAFLSISYLKVSWRVIDKRLPTLMIGLAVVPSLGVLLLDLFFSKDLGKSSYVLFAGPAIVVLLTMVFGEKSDRKPGAPWRSAAGAGYLAGYLLPLLLGLQLTGINFDLERTPGFAGSTLRSTIARIEASAATPVIVIGAGHGRGDPASVIYEAAPETMVCVLNEATDVADLSAQLSRFEEVWMVFAKGNKTADAEQRLFDTLTKDGSHRAVSKAKRLARLKKTRASRRDG